MRERRRRGVGLEIRWSVGHFEWRRRRSSRRRRRRGRATWREGVHEDRQWQVCAAIPHVCQIEGSRAKDHGLKRRRFSIHRIGIVDDAGGREHRRQPDEMRAR
jgi:hypothetical protein